MSQPDYCLDTSVVVRLITREPLPMFDRAAAFLRERHANASSCVVSDLVLAESYFALQHHYDFSKTDALATLLALARHPAIAVTPHALSILALPGIATAKPGLVDRLIHGSAVEAKLTLVSFEKASRTLQDTLILA